MGLVELILIIVVLGFCCWLLFTYVPMPAIARQILIAVIVIFTVVLILQRIGLISGRVHL